MLHLQVNAVIFGAGAAGLWTLDELRRQGRSAVLLETSALGDGQTIASQGIVHGGLKYSLKGLLTASAREAREMPKLWRRCLSGADAPDLSRTEVRSESFYLWGTDSAASRVGMFGAKLGLQAAPRTIEHDQRPPLLRDCQGAVLRVDEQVLSPSSLLAALAAPHQNAILKIDRTKPPSLVTSRPGHAQSIVVCSPEASSELTLLPDWVVLAAGQGNAALREQLGLDASRMQRRPLHMVLVRGPLPEFFGHCVDGGRTRVSITSARDNSGRTVWQVGGQIAEDGVTLDAEALIHRAQAEISSTLPELNLAHTEWSTYRVDRAEGAVAGGGRPDSFHLLKDGNVLTAWPTKLVLVPQLAAAAAKTIVASTTLRAANYSLLTSWPRPAKAAPPWDRAGTWTSYDPLRRAA
ncbi:MAG: FAD-dependent oxidoreductase [Pirellulaceae bacterium]